jgi:hypothetical protein
MNPFLRYDQRRSFFCVIVTLLMFCSSLGTELAAYPESAFSTKIIHQEAVDPAPIIYVKQGATGTGTSWSNAAGDLQSMIAQAPEGAQVWVAKGTYKPATNQSFSMKRGVVIYGGFPDNNNNANMEDRDWNTHLTTLQGNGTSVVKNENNALTPADILDGFTITGGNAQDGGGIYNVSVSPSYFNLVITQNTAVFGGGIAIGGFSAPAAPRLTNVLISKNTASAGGGGMVTANSSPLLTNITISDNIAPSGGEMLGGGTGTAVIRNSIIYGRGVEAQLNDIQNSLVQNQSNASYTHIAHNNLPTHTDPLFINPAWGNFKLQATSPAKDKGNNTFFEGLNLSTKDLAGNPRVYEFPNAGLIDMGTYENQGLQSEPEVNIIYVRQGGSGNGRSWANAMGNLQNAIHVPGVEQVWVAKGTYQPASGESFSMKRGVVIYGGFPDNNNSAGLDDRDWKAHLTTLQGNGSSVVKNENNTLTPADILDGFTITGGNTQAGGGILNVESSPSYINLVIAQNTATIYAGGMMITGISRSSSAPRLTNVLIHGNTAGYAVGGVINNSSPLLTNVTISGNSSPIFGNEWYDESKTAVIRNSIIYGNGVTGQSGSIQNSLMQNQEENGSYGEAVNGNLPTGTNPLFTDPAAGNYTPQTTSPTKNKGSNTFFNGLNAKTKDLAGSLRLAGATIDMGAYESPEDPMPVTWISMEGRLNDQRQAVIIWETVETKVSHYEVERSDNAKNFQVVKTLDAVRTGAGHYSYTDPVPVLGRFYYRIRQVDMDDTFSYSRMLSIRAEGRNDLFAYPNPAHDLITIELGPDYIGSKASLLSPAGVVLQQTEVKGQKFILDIRRYNSGIYILQLQDGKVLKLIKQK